MGKPDRDPERPRLAPLAEPPLPLLLPLHPEYDPRGTTPILPMAPATFLSLCGQALAK